MGKHKYRQPAAPAIAALKKTDPKQFDLMPFVKDTTGTNTAFTDGYRKGVEACKEAMNDETTRIFAEGYNMGIQFMQEVIITVMMDPEAMSGDPFSFIITKRNKEPRGSKFWKALKETYGYYEGAILPGPETDYRREQLTRLVGPIIGDHKTFEERFPFVKNIDYSGAVARRRGIRR